MTLPTFHIGKYEIAGGVLAPMAGYTDIAFRELCKAFGAGLTVTEMVSVRGLVHGNAATERLMRLSPLETPSCIQLFGSEPDDFARAAPLVNSDIIDINMGCPMPKIVKNGDGSALMTDPKRAGDIVRALKESTDKPITVKTRLGFGMGDDGAEELIARVAEAGAAAVTLHGRYAEQRYSGEADYAKMSELAAKATVPVVCNGDLRDITPKPPFAANMIGRYALGDPAVFSGGRAAPVDTARKHFKILLAYFDERYAVLQMRKFAAHYFKDVSGGRRVRTEIYAANNADEIGSALDKAEKFM